MPSVFLPLRRAPPQLLLRYSRTTTRQTILTVIIAILILQISCASPFLASKSNKRDTSTSAKAILSFSKSSDAVASTTIVRSSRSNNGIEEQSGKSTALSRPSAENTTEEKQENPVLVAASFKRGEEEIDTGDLTTSLSYSDSYSDLLLRKGGYRSEGKIFKTYWPHNISALSMVLPAAATRAPKKNDNIAISDEDFDSFLLDRVQTWPTCNTTVLIPNGYTSVPNYSFQRCSSLVYLILPKSIVSIGGSAFQYCIKLTAVTLPSSITGIGSYAFNSCTSLVVVTFLSSSVTEIGDSAFARCSSLLRITLPSSITSVGNYAFAFCNSLVAVTFSSNIFVGWQKFKEAYAFYQDRSLQCINTTSLEVVDAIRSSCQSSCPFANQCAAPVAILPWPYCAPTVIIPKGYKSVPNNAFYDCGTLISLILPSSVATIGNYAFMQCSSLTILFIPSSVTSIGNYAFYGCTSLAAITLFTKVIGMDAFSNNFGLQCINTTSVDIFNAIVLSCRSCSNAHQCAVPPTLSHWPPCDVAVIIPNGYTSVPNSAFYGCNILITLTLPTSLKSIEDFAFYYCVGLESVNVPSTVTRIGTWAFYNCVSLSTVTFTRGIIVSFGYGTFQNDNSLQCVITNSTAVFIAVVSSCYPNCPKAHQCIASPMPSAVPTLRPNANSLSYSPTMASGLLPLPTCAATVAIPNGYTEIPSYAFFGCASMVTLTLPARSVSVIGDFAFCSCIGLVSVTLPNSVTSIGNSAFYNCINLVTVSLPSGITKIGSGTFQNDINLQCIVTGSMVAFNASYKSCGGTCLNARQCTGEPTSVPTTAALTSSGDDGEGRYYSSFGGGVVPRIGGGRVRDTAIVFVGGFGALTIAIAILCHLYKKLQNGGPNGAKTNRNIYENLENEMMAGDPVSSSSPRSEAITAPPPPSLWSLSSV